jgi:hypothetical protein
MDLQNNIHIRAIADILHNVGERVEGNLICDIDCDNYVIDRNFAKIHNLKVLCAGKKRICEIGVNACHRLLLMLLVNPDAEYTLFDLGNHKYTRPCIEYIRSQFPAAKIEIIYGNSVETIPNYIAQGPEKYDLCHLDGGHTREVFSHDYENVKKMVGPDGTVIFDDYDLGDIHNFVNSKVSTGDIVEVKDPLLLKTGLHFVYRHV